MSHFEVQENCLFGGWTNTWTTYDDEGNEVPSTFDKRSDAEDELEDMLNDCRQAVEMGNMEDIPSRNDFRIVEVNDE